MVFDTNGGSISLHDPFLGLTSRPNELCRWKLRLLSIWLMVWCQTNTDRRRGRSKTNLEFWEREREMFYLTTHSTHFIYGYMASDIWLRTILIVRKETRCRHIGYSYRLTARVLLYAPSQRQDNTYHGLCYTSRGALAGTRNSSMGPPHEGSIRRPIAPWANVEFWSQRYWTAMRTLIGRFSCGLSLISIL